jgi:SAM-dependent methyltransferase
VQISCRTQQLSQAFRRNWPGLPRNRHPARSRRQVPYSSQLYFTREALEQSSPFEVSSYRSSRFEGFRRLVDLGCSVGGDTLSLAKIAPTTGIDRDPLRLLMAQANLQALGLASRTDLVRADLTGPLPLQPDPDTALFFDPARRTPGGAFIPWKPTSHPCV